MDKFSIITVCYNAEKEILDTLESVLGQISNNFQYVIKDGNSSDSTREIVKQYIPRFEKRGVEVQLISGKDKGIFDAMNVALEYATGQYVNFLNAGDSFFCDRVLSDLSILIENESPDIIYGHTMCSFYNGSKLVFIQNAKNVFEGIYQQACFIRRDIFRQYKFNIRYNLLADYELLIRLYNDNLQFTHVNIIVGIYDRNGISKKEYGKFFKQMNEIKKKYGISVHEESEFTYFIKTQFNKKFPMFSDWLYAIHTIKKSKTKFLF